MVEWIKTWLTPEAAGTVVALQAVIVLVLLTILCVNARYPARRSPLSKHRSRKEGVSDLLNCSFVVGDGIIANKDGSLMASYTLEANDNDNLTPVDRMALAERLNEAFMALGTGWMIHFDNARFRAPSYSRPDESHFPDPVSAAMDDERREYFTSAEKLYDGLMVMTVTWFPPLKIVQKLEELMFEKDPAAAAKEKDKDPCAQMRAIVDEFKRNLTILEGRLEGAFGRRHPTRMKSFWEDTEDGPAEYDYQLQWIRYCLTGDFTRVRMPPCPAYIDCLLASKELWPGTTPKIGDHFVQVVTINGFPAASEPGILDALSRLSCEYRWNTRFIFLDQQDAISRMEKLSKLYKQQERGIVDLIVNSQNPKVNTFAVEMRQECERMIHDIRRGDRPAGFYNTNIVLRSRNLANLQRNAEFILKTIEEMGFPARIETVNCLDAFLGTIPGHGYENCRLAIVNTMNLAHLLPTSTIWPGEKEAPCPYYPPHSPALMYCVTNGATPFRLNLHCGDIGHTLIIGPTGSGKSVLLATLVAQLLRYPKMRIFAFDKGMSMFTLCKAVGGRHYDLAGDEQKIYDEEGNVIGQKANFAFCPLQNLSSKNDQAWAIQYIEALCNLNEPDPTKYVNDTQKAAIKDTITNMAATNNGLRSLEYFHAQVADLRVKSLLKDYTKEGFMGYMMAADKDELDAGKNYGLSCFETESLMGMGDDRYRLPVLLYLFRQIDRSLKEYDEKKGVVPEPSVIVLDEAWTMLSNPVFRNEIKRWMKELRKKNCAIIMATQSLTDAAESGIFADIREACQTRIFLPNPYARNAETRKLYASMNLNDKQIDIIADAIPKRQYYYSSPDGHRLFELALGPKELPFVAVSDRASLAQVKSIIREHGDEPRKWVPHWLKARGLPPDCIDFDHESA